MGMQEGNTGRECSDRQVRRSAKTPNWEEDFLFMALRHVWKDSDTYQAIFDEGRVIQAKRSLLSIGTQRFGPADDTVQARLNAITDLERLDRQIDRLFEATSWQDLLDTP
jgi:hypothetical protein